MKSVIIMLPTLDEAKGLDMVAEKIPYAKIEDMGWKATVWVIDGGSNDETYSIAQKHGFHFIRQQGKGKGAAMRLGFTKFLEYDHDALVMLDSDGTYDAKEIPKFLDSLSSCDVVIGDRLNGKIEPDAMTRFNFVGNHLLTWLATGMYGVTTNDLCSGYWGFNKMAISRLKLNSMRFEIEAEMYTSCVNEELHLKSIPIRYSSRIGKAKLGSISDGWRIFRKLIVRRIFGTPIEAKMGKGNFDIE
jgi:glycosyltransferase involved in cell wall biosynthesis